jgi:hypothetical protein
LFAVLYMVLCIVLSLGLSRTTGGGMQESALKKRAETQQSYSPASVLEEGLPMQQEEGGGAATETGSVQQGEGTQAPQGEGALPMLPQGEGEGEQE